MSKSNHTALTKFKKSIYRLIKEHASIIWIKSCDKELIYDILRDIMVNGDSNNGGLIDKKYVNTWNVAYGSVLFGNNPREKSTTTDLKTVLRSFLKDDLYKLLILDDICTLLTEHEEKTEVVGLLQEFAYNNSKWVTKNKKKWNLLLNAENLTPNNKELQPLNSKSIIIISPKLEIVDNLKHLIEVVEEPIPDEKDIMHELGFDRIESNPNILRQLKRDRGIYCHGRYKYSHAFMKEYAKNSKKLVSSLHGMYLYQIRRLLYSLQIHSNNENVKQILEPYENITHRFLHDFISDEKKRLVQNSGLLQVIDIDNEKQKDRIGNINNLRKFLDSQKDIIDNIENYNEYMPRPKGILLVGAPGCGKSEAAKSIAAILEKPLLRLDIGALMGQYVGVSEHNLIEAIRIAEAAAPCVLWIDEIEKAFAGFGNSEGDNDITVMRMVGYFLTWMQERKSLVYLVATANSLDNLRPELLRKGRWDKIMYLSYPNEEGIVDILKKCLNKYKLELDVSMEVNENRVYKDELFKQLVDLIYNQEMSGADIDSIIIEAYNRVFISSDDRSQRIEKISVSDCIAIASSNKILEARKEADDNTVKEQLRNYKISSGRLNWDVDKETRVQQAINEYRLSAGGYDHTLSENELVDDAIANIKISTSQTYLSNEQEIRKLIRAKVKRSKKQDDEMLRLIRERVENEEKEKETLINLMKEIHSHKNREDQEKYYRTKGYESAS